MRKYESNPSCVGGISWKYLTLNPKKLLLKIKMIF